MTRREVLLGAGTVAASHLGVRRARAESAQEKGRRLVMDAYNAMGGDAFREVFNQVTTGRGYSFYRASVRGLARITVYDRYEPMQPNADGEWLPVARKEIYTEKGDFYSLFVNGKGWEVTFQGARPLPEDMLTRYRVGTRRDFHYFLRYRLEEPGLYFYHTGLEIVDNIPTEAVEVSDGEGETITVNLRQSDGLPHMARYLRRDPKTRIPFEEKTIWSKYRDLPGGVLLPWNIRKERDGEQIYEQFASEIEINQQLKPDIFELPRGIEMLPPNP